MSRYRAVAIETRTALCRGRRQCIGREVARLAKAGVDGCESLQNTQPREPASGTSHTHPRGPRAADRSARPVFWCDVWQWTPQTTGLIGAAAFAAMPDGAVLVNVARGEIATSRRWRRPSRQDACAAPPSTCTSESSSATPAGGHLWRDPRVLITPHTSAQTQNASRRRSTELFCDNLGRYLAGGCPGQRGGRPRGIERVAAAPAESRILSVMLARSRPPSA